jgi:hypothetical protein
MDPIGASHALVVRARQLVSRRIAGVADDLLQQIDVHR